MPKVTNLQLLEIVLECPGATDAELGAALGLSRVTISRRKNSPKFIALVQSHFRNSFAIFKTARIKAARRICKAIDSDDERVALKASELVCELVKEATPPDAERSSSDFHDHVLQTLKKMNRDRALRDASEKKFKETGFQALTDEEGAEVVNGFEKKGTANGTKK